MEQILRDVLPYTAAFTSVLSVAALALILNLSKQVKDVYAERVELINERTRVLEERLKAKDERIEELNLKVTKVGATLGIEEFKEAQSVGVKIHDIGDNFSGKIAGRDIIGTITEIGKRVEENSHFLHKNLNQNIDRLIDQSQKLVAQKKETPIVKQEYFHTKISVPDDRFYTDDRDLQDKKPSFIGGEATREWLNRRFRLLMSIPGAKEEIQSSVQNIESAGWAVDEVRFDISPRIVDVSFNCTQRISIEDLSNF